MLTMLISLLMVAPFPSVATQSNDTGKYSDQLFRDAVYDRGGTASPLVLVTIVNGQTGEQRTGCTRVNALAAAVALDRGWNREPEDDEMDDILLKTSGRRFVFLTKRSLIGSGYYSLDDEREACALLRQGKPAFAADIEKATVPGRPGRPIGSTAGK